MKNPGGRRRGWNPRKSKNNGAARHCQGPGTGRGQTAPGETGPSRVAAGETVAAAMQLAIGLLTASLDSPELEARALATLMPHDADGLGDFMAGLHVVSELLIHELHEATGEPPEAILQRLAIMAEHRRGTPSAG